MRKNNTLLKILFPCVLLFCLLVAGSLFLTECGKKEEKAPEKIENESDTDLEIEVDENTWPNVVPDLDNDNTGTTDTDAKSESNAGSTGTQSLADKGATQEDGEEPADKNKEQTEQDEDGDAFDTNISLYAPK